MDLYAEIAKWVGWPAIVAVLIVAGGFIVWALNNRIKLHKETIQNLEREWGKYKSVAKAEDSYITVDYGIRITSPKNNEVVGQWIDVSGVYSVMPPPGTLRLFCVKSVKTDKGERFWPQEIVKEFFPETNTWNARVNIGDPTEAEWSIIAAIVGQPTIILWDFYYKVGPKIGWWDFEGWPTDSRICHRVSVIRK